MIGKTISRYRILSEPGAGAADYEQSGSQLTQSGMSVEKTRFTTHVLSLLVSWLFPSLVFSGQVHAVAICGVGLQLRNRTSRFRFCAVAAR
jgi:hypothetical protein